MAEYPDAALSLGRGRVAFATTYYIGGATLPSYSLTVLDLRSDTRAEVPGFAPSRAIEVGGWSPDGSSLAIIRAGEIFVVDVASGNQTKITSCQQFQGGADCYNPRWSPDGRWIAFNIGFPYADPALSNGGLYLMNARCLESPSTCMGAITARVPVTDDPGWSHFSETFCWSPDARHLAFPSGQGITLFDIDAWMRVQTLPAPRSIEELAWSPDGEYIAVGTADEIAIVSVTTGEFHEVIHAADTVFLVSWLAVDGLAP
jgi:WD40 repeat protein